MTKMSNQQEAEILENSKNRDGMYPLPIVQQMCHLLRYGARVLDAGCGMGRHTKYLGFYGCEVDAWDIDGKNLVDLYKEAIRYGLKCSFFVSNQILALFSPLC